MVPEEVMLAMVPVPVDVMLVRTPVVALRVVRVKTPPVKVMEGAVIAEEKVVVSGELEVLINFVFESFPIMVVETSVPFNVSVVNDPWLACMSTALIYMMLCATLLVSVDAIVHVPVPPEDPLEQVGA